MSEIDFDIVILGAGVVGLTFACALPANLRIAIVEAQNDAMAIIDEYDLRVYALNRASQNVLTQLDVWQTLKRSMPYQHMQVWDDFGAIHFGCNDVASHELGHIIEHQILIQALQAKLNKVTWFRPARATALYLGDKALITLDSGEHLRTELLVGADGAHSWLRQQAGFELREWDYGHTAIIATVQTEHPHQATAWQHFLPQGPLAFLPLPDPHTCSIVWSTESDVAKDLLQLSDHDFKTALANAFAKRLGAITHSSARQAFPLRMRHAKQYVKPHLALIGDAAHTIHPLAGQGMNLGVMDAACLAQVIAECRSAAFGDLYTLRRYERWRKTDNLIMIAAMEILKRLFSYPKLDVLRNLGLNWVDQLPLLKKAFMRKAMGLSGDLPSLAKA